MKILIVTENSHCGGLDSFLVTLMNNWPHPEDDLTLMCNASHPGLDVIRARLRRPCHVVAHHLPLPWVSTQTAKRRGGVLGLLRKLAAWPRRYAYFLYYLAAFPRYFKRLKANRLLVVNGGYPAGLTCRAASIAWGLSGRRPLSVHNFHNFAQMPRWWERWIEHAIDALVRKYSLAMVSVSEVCARSLVERPAFRGFGRVAYIYNGIESEEPPDCPGNVKTELGIPDQSPMCLMLGTYEPRKGHEFLLRAFSLVVQRRPDAFLVICGFGYPPEVARVEHAVTAEGLQLNVRLQGFRSDVDALLAESDVLLVPSQTHESFGLTIVEAMAHKAPVVATRIGGIPEVLHEAEGGFITDPTDAEGFAARILALLADPALRVEQGQRGYDRYRTKFTARRMTEEYACLVRGDHECEG